MNATLDPVTRVLLAVIALALLWLAIQPHFLPTPAGAASRGPRERKPREGRWAAAATGSNPCAARTRSHESQPHGDQVRKGQRDGERRG